MMAPAVALAFETVDTLPWPSLGRFPAYPREEAQPYDIWLQGGVMHDDNVLRRETGEQSDNVSRLGAGLRWERRIVGRQSLRLEARGDYYFFDRFDELNHLAYLLNGAWVWEVGNRLSGTVGFGRERRLADLAEIQDPIRDMITTTRVFATAGYLVTPRIRVRAGVTGARGDSSTRAEADTRTTSVALGADYVSGLGNTVGLEYRQAEGDAPTTQRIDPLGLFVNNDFDEREVALVATYRIGERLRSEGRIGRTEREYSELPGRDFSGTTGRLSLEWFPGNKTGIEIEAYREPRSIVDIAASHVLVEGIAIGPNWAPTPKLVFSARLVREDRKFEGDPLLVLAAGEPLRDDQLSGIRFGVGWEPLRHWQFSFSYDHGERDSNIVGRGYEFNAFTANVAWRY